MFLFVEFYGGTMMIEVAQGGCETEYAIVEREMQASVRAHRDTQGGHFTHYHVVRVSFK